MARKNIPFYMFVDEETQSYLKNTSSYTEDNKRVGLWRIIVAHNVPYTDARRNGKVRNSVLKIILGARLGGKSNLSETIFLGVQKIDLCAV